MTKVKETFIFFILVFLTSCIHPDSSKSSHEWNETREDITSDSLDLNDSSKLINANFKETKDNYSIWFYDCITDSIIKFKDLKRDAVTPSNLIKIINSKYIDNVLLDFSKISHDTIFVKIDESEYLTQRMGTTGANEYMITTIFTLTELKNIRYVNIDFEYGDHAMPGVYSRKYYLDWIEKNK